MNSEDSVTSTFELRYLNIFNKATSLSPTVILKLTEDVPMVVEFQISEIGLLKFFLAPKINCENSSK